MVHSRIEAPSRPTTQTSFRAHRKRRREAANLLRSSAKTARPGGLDWDHFRALYYPASRRHDLEAIVAYGDYRRSPRPQAEGEAAPAEDTSSADAVSLGEWEGEGGALRDPSSGSRER